MKRTGYLIIVTLCLCLSFCVGCSCRCSNKEKEFRMIDMTNKTECISIHALLLEKAEFNSDYAEEIQCLFKLINPEAYENGFAYGKINESDDLLNAAEQALKDCFDKEYIDTGSEGPYIEYSEPGDIGQAAYYCGGETYAVFEMSEGKLLFCADIRLNKNLKKLDKHQDGIWFEPMNLIDPLRLRKYFEPTESEIIWQPNYTINLCNATEDELITIYRACGWQYIPETRKDIPDAEAAFNYALEYINESGLLKRMSSEKTEVYYNQKIDAWIVVNNTLFQVFDSEGRYICVL